jgi:hypothetical protein
MKLDNDARFPYPVLSKDTFDYKEANFGFAEQAEVQETSSGETIVSFSIDLDEETLRSTINSGEAGLGIFVRCPATFYTELFTIEDYKSSIYIEGGALRRSVFLRPLIWAKREMSDYSNKNLVDEFNKKWNFESGKILAYADEQSFFAGREKIVPMDTIFKLEKRPGYENGEINVEPEDNKIVICSSDNTHDKLARLRKGNKNDRAIMLNTVYIQAVMKILSSLKKSPIAFIESDWFITFDAQCQQKGIDYESCDILTAAQKLLKYPINEL